MRKNNIKTFSEWNRLGYYINSGAKAVKFKDGEAMFEQGQVHRANPVVAHKNSDWYNWMDASDGTAFDAADMFAVEPH